MNQRIRRLLILFGVFLLLGSGCVAMPAPGSATTTDSTAATINLAQAAQLTTTTQLTIRVYDEAAGDYRAAPPITDPDTIAAVVHALDQPLPLQPALFCTAAYELIFQRADGTTVLFSAGCTGEGEHFLQGGDTPLQDQAVALPPDLDARLAAYGER